jgi:hypothetical protein
VAVTSRSPAGVAGSVSRSTPWWCRRSGLYLHNTDKDEMGFNGDLVQQHSGKPMSALGQKRTLRRVCVMSALPPKADMDQHGSDVRFVPKADIVP